MKRADLIAAVEEANSVAGIPNDMARILVETVADVFVTRVASGVFRASREVVCPMTMAGFFEGNNRWTDKRLKDGAGLRWVYAFDDAVVRMGERGLVIEVED